MNNAKNRNGITIFLSVLVLVAWVMVIGGWVKGSSADRYLSSKGNTDVPETQVVAQTATPESFLQTAPEASDATAPVETPLEASAARALDVSGIWDMTFHRYYAIENEGAWDSIGMEEIFLWMEIHSGTQFECEIMPFEGTLNGESYGDSLAIEPRLHTGEVVGNTVRLYLDLDDFYLNPDLEVEDTIQPDYVEIPITAVNGLPSGTYDFTWVVDVEGSNLQSRITIELKKR